MKLWYGQKGWGWWLFEVSYKTKWFIGLSIQHEEPQSEIGETK